MFDQLSERLQGVLSDVRSRGKLSEDDVNKALREVRLALLEADVNFKVVKDFTAALKERLAGEEISEALNPGQTVVKAVNDELTELMGGSGRDLVFAPSGPTVILMGGLQGSGKTTAMRQARQAPGQAEQGRRPGRLRPAAAGGGRAAREARRPGQGPRLLAAGGDRRGQGREVGARPGRPGEPRRPDRRHGRPPARRPGADGRAGGGPEGGQAARRPPGRRRDDGPGRRQRRRELRRGRRLRRRRDHQARRGRPRRRRALGPGGHRQADHLRLDGREARRARALPPGPDGRAHPRHGRRHVADREDPGRVRRGRGRRSRAQDPQAAVHARRLPDPDEAGAAAWARSAT